MTNDELKKKILTIVRGAMLEADELPFIETTDNIANALIAAGIGDVKDVEAEANRYEMLYKLQNRDMALAERRAHDAEHRAEVAERALELMARGECTFASPEYYKEQAELELAKEVKNNG